MAFFLAPEAYQGITPADRNHLYFSIYFHADSSIPKASVSRQETNDGRERMMPRADQTDLRNPSTRSPCDARGKPFGIARAYHCRNWLTRGNRSCCFTLKAKG